MFLVYFSFYIIKSYFLLHATLTPTDLILLYVRSIKEADEIQVNTLYSHASMLFSIIHSVAIILLWLKFDLKKISGCTCLV